MEQIDPSFTFALALGAGVVAQLVASHLRIPSIVPLLATGIILGPDGLRLILPRSLGEGLFPLVSLAVAVILFEGGLNLDLRRLRREGSAIRRLVTVGALVTVTGGALAATAIMGWSPRLAILFGTLVIVTGPTVIRPLLRNVPLRPRVATVLEAEGVLIDPIGAIVAVVTLQVVLTPGLDSFTAGFLGLLYRLGFGAGAGLLFGFAIVGVLRLRRAIPEGLENLVVIGTALVTFEVCETVLSESGILAVTVAGVVVGNMETRVSRELGFALGEFLQENGGQVLFADINPGHCLAAEERGFHVVYGNALELRTLARMRLERARAVIGLTANNEVNSHFVGEARDEFDVRKGFVAVNRGSSEVTSRIVEKQESRVLFDGPKDVERWHVRFRHDQVTVGQFRYLEPEAAAEEADGASGAQESGSDTAGGAGPYILLAVKREERWEPFHEDLEPEAGEIAAVAIYRDAEEPAHRALARIGWTPSEPDSQ